MDLVILMIRTLFFYFLIMLVMRLLLKRKKLSLFDFIIAFMIAQLSVIGLNRPGEPLYLILIPIGVLCALHIVFGSVFRKRDETKQREREIASLFDGAPFKQAAADVEFSSEMEPIEVEYPTGPLPLLLILDGQVLDDNLRQLGQTRFWLKNQVQKFGARRFKEVAYCSIDSFGRLFLDKKNN